MGANGVKMSEDPDLAMQSGCVHRKSGPLEALQLHFQVAEIRWRRLFKAYGQRVSQPEAAGKDQEDDPTDDGPEERQRFGGGPGRFVGN